MLDSVSCFFIYMNQLNFVGAAHRPVHYFRIIKDSGGYK